MKALILGTRGSSLALTQSRWVASQLEAATGRSVELRIIRTTGDAVQDRPLPEIGGKGLFTAELDRALLDGEIDFAVHSLKDLPTEMEPGLVLAAVPEREDPRDVLVVREGTAPRIMNWRRGARLGTSSTRRRALALAVRADLEVEPIRGNVDTRLRKLDEGQVDALVLAAAGLRRLGLGRRTSHALDVTLWPPAPGQGALGILAREGDSETGSTLATLDDAAARTATTFERTLLAALGGGCSAPIAAVGLPHDGGLRGWGMVLSSDGSRMVKVDRSGALTDPEGLGREVARILVERGAREIMDPVPPEASAKAEP